MKIEGRHFWMIIVLIFAIGVFYNPQGFEMHWIITWILLSNVGWEISKLRLTGVGRT